MLSFQIEKVHRESHTSWNKPTPRSITEEAQNSANRGRSCSLVELGGKKDFPTKDWELEITESDQKLEISTTTEARQWGKDFKVLRENYLQPRFNWAQLIKCEDRVKPLSSDIEDSKIHSVAPTLTSTEGCAVQKGVHCRWGTHENKEMECSEEDKKIFLSDGVERAQGHASPSCVAGPESSSPGGGRLEGSRKFSPKRWNY